MTNKVRELRTTAGLTQEALGQKVGVSRVTINCLENGVYLPSIELAFRLARFFQKPIEDIFSLEENG
ncbi:MAG: helix-turn-helix transcriptional regulator [Elusimicrobia bacterium]|nr:helix-turn-helix transcriptional regulator [Elusimicrobiota bacterium]